MPELPEVKCHAEKLNELLAGKTLLAIKLHRGSYTDSPKPKYARFRKDVKEYQSQKVKAVKNHGKWMYICFEDGENPYLGIHHGMEGSWCREPDNKHIILEFVYDSVGKDSVGRIYFQDSRRFGTFNFLTQKEWEVQLGKLGPCAFSINESAEIYNRFASIRRIQDKPLGEVLMDQRVIAGIGNYLRADIMYHARLSPHRTIDSLSEMDVAWLFVAMWIVLRKSYRARAVGESYKYLVYSRKVCPHREEVEKFKDRQKRTVHWVPNFQK